MWDSLENLCRVRMCSDVVFRWFLASTPGSRRLNWTIWLRKLRPVSPSNTQTMRFLPRALPCPICTRKRRRCFHRWCTTATTTQMQRMGNRRRWFPTSPTALFTQTLTASTLPSSTIATSIITFLVSKHSNDRICFEWMVKLWSGRSTCWCACLLGSTGKTLIARLKLTIWCRKKCSPTLHPPSSTPALPTPSCLRVSCWRWRMIRSKVASPTPAPHFYLNVNFCSLFPRFRLCFSFLFLLFDFFLPSIDKLLSWLFCIEQFPLLLTLNNFLHFWHWILHRNHKTIHFLYYQASTTRLKRVQWFQRMLVALDWMCIPFAHQAHTLLVQMESATVSCQCYAFSTTRRVMWIRAATRDRVHSLFTWSHGMRMFLTFWTWKRIREKRKAERVIFSTPCGFQTCLWNASRPMKTGVFFVRMKRQDWATAGAMHLRFALFAVSHHWTDPFRVVWEEGRRS